MYFLKALEEWVWKKMHKFIGHKKANTICLRKITKQLMLHIHKWTMVFLVSLNDRQGVVYIGT